MSRTGAAGVNGVDARLSPTAVRCLDRQLGEALDLAALYATRRELLLVCTLLDSA